MASRTYYEIRVSNTEDSWTINLSPRSKFRQDRAVAVARMTRDRNPDCAVDLLEVTGLVPVSIAF